MEKKEDVGCLGLKKRKNRNKGDIFGTRSLTETNNSLKTEHSGHIYDHYYDSLYAM